MYQGSPPRGQTEAFLNYLLRRCWQELLEARPGEFYFVDRPGAPIEVRLGYLLAEDAWGQGYASELVEGFVRWCRQHPPIASIAGGVARDNVASVRVLTKNGFQRDSTADVGDVNLYRLTLTRPDVTFKDAAGVDEALAVLAEVVDFLRTLERYRAIGARVPKGILLIGAPGTGKTYLARVVAGSRSERPMPWAYARTSGPVIASGGFPGARTSPAAYGSSSRRSGGSRSGAPSPLRKAYRA